MADQFFGLTDTGRRRQNNEDTFIAAYTDDNRFIVACVIDGVGGYSGGEIAAEIAKEVILRKLTNPEGELITLLKDCFNQANEKILAEKSLVKEHNQMACVATLALVDIARNQFYYAHVGDTRLYLLRDQSLVKISHDQSFVGFLEDSGRLTETDAMAHPKRNEINKALGFEGRLDTKVDYIETGQSPFLPADLLLLCSDGLTDMVNKAEITGIINHESSLKEKCRQLIDAANTNGGNDNITVVLVKNQKEQLQHSATRPASIPKKTNEKTKVQKQAAPVPLAAESNKSARSKSNKVLVILLCLLIMILLLANVYQHYYNRAFEKTAFPLPLMLPAQKNSGSLQRKFQQAIDSVKGHVLILNDTSYQTSILLNSPIAIKNDTLIIKAKGKIMLKCDTGFKGPALNLAKSCKKIVLDSLTVVDFPVAIASYGSALQLKNVFFENCTVQIQNSWALPAKKYLSGSVPPAIFNADTTPHHNKTK